MALITLSTIANIFKTIQPEGFESGVIGVSPTLGLMTKKTDFYGNVKQLDWLIDRGGGAGSDFATAQTNGGTPNHQKPNITRSRLYAVRQVSNEAILASKKDSGALVNLLKHILETATEELRYRAGSLILGDGTGAIGQISAGSTVGNATITLADPTQVVNFRVGQVLATFTAGDSVVNTGDVTLTAVNEDTGDLTVSSNWAAQSSGVAAGDYIVPKLDYLSVPVGMFFWNPPTPNTFTNSCFGVTRAAGTNTMNGSRYAPSSGSIDEVIKDAMSRHAMQGGEHDSLILNPLDWASLEKQSNNWQRINKNAVGSNGKEIASIGFNALVMNSPKGAVNVYSDPFMPRYKGKLTKMSSWELWSLEEAFGLIKEGMGEGGGTPISNADGIELRFGGYWQTVLRRPRDSMDITFPTG